MELYQLSVISGLIAVLTPSIFIFLFVCSSIFEKLGNSTYQHGLNILFFTILTVTIYTYCLPYFLNIEYLNSNDYKSYVTLLAHIPQVILSVWFFLIFKKKNGFNGKVSLSLFRFFGIVTLSIRLVVASFSSTGPIIGTLLIGNSENINIKLGFLLFSGGLILPFALVMWLFSRKYAKLKQRTWWQVSQFIVFGVLLLNSLVQLIFLI